MKRVLVTCAGAGVAQGIIKSIQMSGLPVEILAVDTSDYAAALYWPTTYSAPVPAVDDAGFLEHLANLCNNYHVSAIIPGSDSDLLWFARNAKYVEQKTGAKVIVSSLTTVSLCRNKLALMQYFKAVGLPYIPTIQLKCVEDALALLDEYHSVIIKDRYGTASRNLAICTSAEDVRYWYPKIPNPIAQPTAGTPSFERVSDEYSCTVYTKRNGDLVGPFIARRYMRHGSSWVVEVRDVPELHRPLFEIAKSLPSVVGSLNIQLFYDGTNIKPFEVNARFSGSVAVRAWFGFNEPEMALREYVFGNRVKPASIRQGVAIRQTEDVYVEGAQLDTLTKHLGHGTTDLRHLGVKG